MIIRTLLLSGILFLCFKSNAQDLIDSVQWKVGKKIQFTFEGRGAFIIIPDHPESGNPWVWRARFPNWHTEMDSILVSKGFHIAYVDTDGLLGHPQAMQVWDRFYTFLTKKYELAEKVALEGVSRGGLFVYGWAKRNPWKVSCIYLEAPVCDPRSWPGGKGDGIGSQKDWDHWLDLYNYAPNEVPDIVDIPLNNLESLASFKVPILHVIGLKDKVVPPSENTFPLVQSYIEHGGPASIYPMTRGEQNLMGHHFEIEKPELFAKFIIEHSMPVQNQLNANRYIEVNKGIDRAYRKFEEEKTGTVAFLGGSITHNPGWRNKISQYLKEKFPETTFQFIAAGIPSLGSTPHAFRFEKDVLSHGIPDLLFVESAVNDRTNGFSKEAQIRALEGIVRHAKQRNRNMDIVLMAFADPDKMGDYDLGEIPEEVEVHKLVSKHYNLPFINLAREVYDRVRSNEFSWKYDFKNLHPSPFGQEIYFRTMKELLEMDNLASSNYDFVMPDPLDRYSYDHGKYLPVTSADKLSGFQVNSSWKPDSNISTREGFVKVPMLVGEDPGSSFQFEFYGEAIGIAIISGPDAGRILYTIDGKKYPPLELYTRWSSQLHLPWYLMLDDELEQGKHTLVVEISDASHDDSLGTACRIVYFLQGL